MDGEGGIVSGVLRAVSWAGLYALALVFPLLVAALLDPVAAPRRFAIELAAAAGFVAWTVMTCEFGLVARLRAASKPFGTDALMRFHRLMGIAALGFLVAHVVLSGAPASSLNPFRAGVRDGAGSLAFWAAVLLVATSVWRRRLRFPYEVWHVLHLLLSVAIVAGALLHVLDRGAYAAAPEVRAVVMGYAAVFGALLAWYRFVRPLQQWRCPWEVVENREEAGDTRTLTLRPHGHAGWAFDPGQFAWITIGRTPLGQPHPISISSSSERPTDGTLQFSIKALGSWSGKRIPALGPGDRVWLDGPYGVFSIDAYPAQGFVLIAGGIGIAPIRSMLLTLRDRGDRRPVLLLCAAHDRSREIFADQVDRLRDELDLTVVRVYEEPGPDDAAERGYVTADVLRRHLPPWWRHAQYFVCGPGPMMDMVEAGLVELGVDDDRIQTERFDMV